MLIKDQFGSWSFGDQYFHTELACKSCTVMHCKKGLKSMFAPTVALQGWKTLCMALLT